MRKASKHSAILLLIGVFALGLLGAAYTLWYENLSLTANVATGTFDADLSMHDPVTHADSLLGVPVVAINPANPPALSGGLASFFDNGPRWFTDGASNYGAFLNSNYPEGKPQTTCTGALVNDTNALENGQTSSLTLNLGGLYPYAGCEFEIDITNNGTVPLHFAITKINLYKCTAVNTGCVQTGDAPWSTGLDPTMGLPLGNPQLAQCAAWLGNTFGMVVDGSGGLVHGFNGGPLGWAGFQQINTNVTSPFTSPPGGGISTASLTNAGATTPVQLHTGQSLNCRFKIILDENPLAEGSFYQFKAEYKAYQWNESGN